MPAIAQIENQPMSWEALQASKPWRSLSKQRRVFLTAYIANGEDAIAATHMAYPKAKDKSVVCMSYELRKHPAIVAALEFWKGKDDRQRLLKEVEAHLEDAKPGSVSAQRLLAQKERLLGLGSAKRKSAASAEPSETPRRKYAVGDLVSQNNQHFRVTAVDEEGQPTEGDPL